MKFTTLYETMPRTPQQNFGDPRKRKIYDIKSMPRTPKQNLGDTKIYDIRRKGLTVCYEKNLI